LKAKQLGNELGYYGSKRQNTACIPGEGWQYVVKTVGDNHYIKKVIKRVTKIPKGLVPVVLLILSALLSINLKND
jgi:hypothetical protein